MQKYYMYCGGENKKFLGHLRMFFVLGNKDYGALSVFGTVKVLFCGDVWVR